MREAIARGCDFGFHLCDISLAGSDTWATSQALSLAIKKMSELKGQVKLVFCGKQTNDSDTGHIGPQIAAWLNQPSAAFVRKIEYIDENLIRVERMMEDGYDVLEMPLPSVISVLKEINTPRIASLKGRLAAKKAVIQKLSCADINCDAEQVGINGSPTSVLKCFTPKRESHSVKITGENAREKAANLVKILRERKLV
ncbi:MAG: electron transfer flavoprotein subunit beta/FixA family protein [Elusimicrobia bacterium]|nr:electron transfer flavoprotein subunit beta/FixA family protein [Elusimicrobiota bacterium]